MDFNFKVSDTIWGFITTVVTYLVGKTPLVRKILTKLMDYLAKPLYDWVVRKGYIVAKKIEVKKSQDKLDKAKTEKERDEAIDEMP